MTLIASAGPVLLPLLLLGAAEDGGVPLDQIHIRDPFIVPVAEEKCYYLYGTSVHLPNGTGFDAYTSKDLKHWSGPFPVFRPEEGFWADRDFWAPEVHRYKGKYYLFGTFKAEDRCRGTQILVADSPKGPFKPIGEKSATPGDWECLDGTLFVDESKDPWMVFCHEWLQVNDGGMCAVRLSAELDKTVGEPITLFHASEATWAVGLGEEKDRFVTDGPWLHRMQDGGLVMLWSSVSGTGYALGLARSESGTIQGPWKQVPKPLFQEDGGHGMLFRDLDGRLTLVLHAPNGGGRERARLFRVTEGGAGLTIAPTGQGQSAGE